MISIEVVNGRDVMADIERYGKEATTAIDKATDDTALAIQKDAHMRLNGMLGSDKHTIHGGAGLLGSVYRRVVQSMERIVGSNKHYAPYIEFGIGEMVFTNMDFSEEAKQVAAQFKGVKKVKGFKGDSFLNWAAVNQEKKFQERIEKELNKLIK